MKIPAIPDDHAKNIRSDEHRDFDALKAMGWIRDKQGRKIRIDAPHIKKSALDRDRLFQAYCEMMKSRPPERTQHEWINDQAKRLGLSVKRAVDIIEQGCGGWKSPNSMWWRGISV